MRKINIKNKKGVLFYTIIGLMVIAMVAIVAIHIINTTYVPNEVDLASQRRFNTAIYDTQADMHDVVRHAVYPVIWKMGHDVDAQGVNVYISESEDEMLSNLTDQFIVQMNDDLCHFSDNCTDNSTYYTFKQDTQDVYVGPVENGDVNITWTGDGLTIKVDMSMWASFGTKYSYRNDHVPITVEVPVRLVQMQEKAKAFHDNYDPGINFLSPVRTFTYGMTYGRAYINAYSGLEDNSTLIKQGYFTYDPITQVLSGDPEQMKGFKIGNLADWGSIPASTAYSEWRYLGEPSYLPPGVDFNDSLADIIRGYLAGNLDLGQINQEVTAKDPNAATMSEDQYRAASAAYLQYSEMIQNLTDEIDKWKTDTEPDRGCEDFKTATGNVLQDVLDFVDLSKSHAAQGMEGQGNSTSSHADNADFKGKYGSFEQIDITGIESFLKQIKGNKPNFLSRLDVLPDSDADCSFCTSECISDDVCGKCPGEGDDVEYTYDRDCVEDSCCIEEGADGCFKSGQSCSSCNCKCNIKPELSNDISTTLTGIYNQLFPQIEYMKTLSDRYEDQADSISKLNETVSDIKNQGTVSEGYDVSSSIVYDEVQYTRCLPLSDGFFFGWVNANKGECYYKPIWKDVNKGVCGDVCTSGGLYGAQIAAASCAAIVIVGASEGTGEELARNVIQEAASWFPAIYDIRVEYTMDETLIDDKDRVMLHNIYAGDDDLYGYNLTHQLFTHVAPEFVIYKNHKINTGDVYVIVYIHMDLDKDPEASKKILKAMNNCDGNQCL